MVWKLGILRIYPNWQASSWSHTALTKKLLSVRHILGIWLLELQSVQKWYSSFFSNHSTNFHSNKKKQENFINAVFVTYESWYSQIWYFTIVSNGSCSIIFRFQIIFEFELFRWIVKDGILDQTISITMKLFILKIRL